MLELIEQHRAELDALCRKYGVKRLELFGSAARGDFRPERSDLDFAVGRGHQLSGSKEIADGFDRPAQVPDLLCPSGKGA